MRRNMGPRGQQRRGPVWEHQTNPLMNQGPLMTDHNPLSELDMEIELLKRKRQLVQDQQQLLASERRFSNHGQYDNQMFGYDRQGFDEPSNYGSGGRNFSQLYDHRPAPANPTRFGRPAAAANSRKRYSDSNFSQPAQKRFSAPNSSFGSRSNFSRPSARGAGTNPKSASFRTKNANVRPAASNMRPTASNMRPTASSGTRGTISGPTGKITKPKPQQAPNKLKSYPAERRKALISSAPKDTFTYILKEGEEPDKHVQGRLEYALGKVVGELKSSFGSSPEFATLFTSNQFLRPMKIFIRQRVKEAMLNKPVGPCQEILDEYRKKFPKTTDKDIIDYAFEKGNISNVMQIDRSGNPEEFFKKNMAKLLKLRLNAMFATVKKAYEKREIEEVINETMESLILADSDETKLNETTATDNQTDTSININQSNITDASVGNITNTGENGVDENKSESVEEANNIQEQPTNSAADKTPMQTDTTGNNAADETAKENPNAADTMTDDTENLNDTSANEENATKKDSSGTEKPTPKKSRSQIIQERWKQQKKLEKLMEALIDERLPKVLPLYRDDILKILDLDKMFYTTKGAVIWRAKLKAEGKMSFSGKDQPEKKEDKSAPSTVLFVKVSGRPGLPKKPVMRSFLSKFKPINIKKHKMIPNLLFVGFRNKEEYEKILSHNGKVLNNCTLSIKPSDSKQQNGSADKGNKEADADTKNQETQENQNMDENNQSEAQENQTAEEDQGNLPIKEEKDQEIQNDEQDCLNESLNEQIDDLMTSVQGDAGNDTATQATNLDTVVEDIENEKAENVAVEANGAPDENKNRDVAGNDQVEALKNEEKGGRPATPTRSSTRLAKTATSTPLSVRTRRASRVSQNN